MPRLRTDYITIHCTATIEGKQFTVPDITAMHRARGFATIGYHYLIGLGGETWAGRKPDDSIGAHVAGYNATTLGIAYVGGLDKARRPKDTRTPEQADAMLTLVRRLLKKYPRATVLGHRDLSPDLNHDGVVTPDEWIKMCPCFSARTWARENGLPAAPGDPGVIVRVASEPLPFVGDPA